MLSKGDYQAAVAVTAIGQNAIMQAMWCKQSESECREKEVLLVAATVMKSTNPLNLL